MQFSWLGELYCSCVRDLLNYLRHLHKIADVDLLQHSWSEDEPRISGTVCPSSSNRDFNPFRLTCSHRDSTSHAHAPNRSIEVIGPTMSIRCKRCYK